MALGMRGTKGKGDFRPLGSPALRSVFGRQ